MEFDDAHAERLAAALRKQLDESLTDAVAKGIAQAAKDTDFVDQFWEAGYNRLMSRGRDDISRSVGKRVLTWLSALLLAVGIYLSAKAGLIK